MTIQYTNVPTQQTFVVFNGEVFNNTLLEKMGLTQDDIVTVENPKQYVLNLLRTHQDDFVDACLSDNTIEDNETEKLRKMLKNAKNLDEFNQQFTREFNVADWGLFAFFSLAEFIHSFNKGEVENCSNFLRVIYS